jgi:hypothetical protein
LGKLGRNTLLGLLFDIIDWVIIGSIPVVGDVLDVLIVLVWLGRIGMVGFIAGFELIPVMDVLPINLAIGVYADLKEAEDNPE